MRSPAFLRTDSETGAPFRTGRSDCRGATYTWRNRCHHRGDRSIRRMSGMTAMPSSSDAVTEDMTMSDPQSGKFDDLKARLKDAVAGAEGDADAETLLARMRDAIGKAGS